MRADRAIGVATSGVFPVAKPSVGKRPIAGVREDGSSIRKADWR